MITSTKNQKGKGIGRPFCQATGCFDLADVYVVLKETEEPAYFEVSQDAKYKDASKKNFKDNESFEFDGFKLILYLCKRHDRDFNYLIKGSELRISKRCNLHLLVGQ